MLRRSFLALATSATTAGCLSTVPWRDTPVDAGCPNFLDDTESRCTHTGDPSLALQPSSWQLADGENASIKFTLSNGTDENVAVAEGPVLKRRVDGSWEHFWPNIAPPFEKQLESGASVSWELTFAKDGTEYETDEDIELFELKQGTYAAVVHAQLSDGMIECVAPFEVGDGGLM